MAGLWVGEGVWGKAKGGERGREKRERERERESD